MMEVAMYTGTVRYANYLHVALVRPPLSECMEDGDFKSIHQN